jgi:hypothetical protein
MPGELAHEYWEAYQYRAGSAGVRTRLHVRGWLMDSRGGVVLQPFIEEHIRHVQDEYRQETAPTDKLDVRPDPPELPEVEAYQRELREAVYTSMLAQADGVLSRNLESTLKAYRMARDQQRDAEAVEEGLRHLSYLGEGEAPERAEIRQFVDAQLTEVVK